MIKVLYCADRQLNIYNRYIDMDICTFLYVKARNIGTIIWHTNHPLIFWHIRDKQVESYKEGFFSVDVG
jgi:hypothetical protein